MNKMLLRLTLTAAAAFLAVAHADHMSPWGEGWANMPNDIHNTRMDTRLLDDDDAFRDFVMYGEGADSVNRSLDLETAALEAALPSGHQVDQLAARLDPLPDFLGGGWARYSLFDEEPLVSRVLNINVRLRLIRNNGSPANELLGLTAENAGEAAVSAYFRPYEGADYAACSLVFEDLILSDDGIAQYATFGLSLKEDQAGVIEGVGDCDATADTSEVPILPAVQPTDLVDVGVLTPALDEEVRPVLMGGF
jgi:hypothetical protein